MVTESVVLPPRIKRGDAMPQDARLADFIETQNISYFRKLLVTEAHPDKRAVLSQLLADEQARRGTRIAAASDPLKSDAAGWIKGELRPPQ